MAKKRMGYEAQLFYGTAGSTATTPVLNATDVDFGTDNERGNTTVRGDGSAPPRETEQVTSLKDSITFKMLADDDDTVLADMLAACATGSPVALVAQRSDDGGDGLDGDFTLSKKYNAPLKGEGTYDFTATPTSESGRTPTPTT